MQDIAPPTRVVNGVTLTTPSEAVDPLISDNGIDCTRNLDASNEPDGLQTLTFTIATDMLPGTKTVEVRLQKSATQVKPVFPSFVDRTLVEARILGLTVVRIWGFRSWIASTWRPLVPKVTESQTGDPTRRAMAVLRSP